MFNGREVCMIYNRETGCPRIAAVCKFAHVCLQCNSPYHNAMKCPDIIGKSRPAAGPQNNIGSKPASARPVPKK